MISTGRLALRAVTSAPAAGFNRPRRCFRNACLVVLVLGAAMAPSSFTARAAEVAPCSGRAYASNSYLQNVSVIDTTTNSLVGVVPTGPMPYSPTIAPDGRHVYVANSEGGTISEIDVETNQVVRSLDAGGEHPSGLAVTPDGERLAMTLLGATIFEPGTVRIMTLATGDLSEPIPVGRTPERITLSPDGTRGYVVNSNPTPSLTVIDIPKQTVVTDIPMVGPAFTVVTSDDGTRVYGGLINNDAVVIIDAVTNTVLDYVPTDAGPIGIALLPDQETLLVTNGSAGTIQEIDVVDRKVVRTVDGGPRPGYLELDEAGSKAYITRSPGLGVAVYDVATLTEDAFVPTGWPTAIAVC